MTRDSSLRFGALPGATRTEGPGAESGCARAGWQLPECFAQLWRLLEARLKKHSNREYVQVLRFVGDLRSDGGHACYRRTLDLFSKWFATRELEPWGNFRRKTGLQLAPAEKMSISGAADPPKAIL